MRMVAAIPGGLTVQVDWLGLRVGGQPALSLHLSNEPGEFSQWLCHDNSTINISVIIVIIVITKLLGLKDEDLNGWFRDEDHSGGTMHGLGGAKLPKNVACLFPL